MGNLRNRINVKLVNNKKDYLKCRSKQSYMLHKILKRDLVAIPKSKLALKHHKSAFIGKSILELSKVWMYKFHYDYIKNKYDNKSKVLFKHADSLMNEIKAEYVYKDFRSNKEMFDFSNYSAKSKYYDNLNKVVIGEIKDEIGDVTIDENVGLKSKMYSFLVGNTEQKKAKKRRWKGIGQ